MPCRMANRTLLFLDHDITIAMTVPKLTPSFIMVVVVSALANPDKQVKRKNKE